VRIADLWVDEDFPNEQRRANIDALALRSSSVATANP
jgi:hypothetical protein